MLRSDLSRLEETRLRRAIDAFLAAQPEGELYVANLIEFVKEGLLRSVEDEAGEQDEDASILESAKKKARGKRVRMWIYSHHIYRCVCAGAVCVCF